jgi:hypothetical protein
VQKKEPHKTKKEKKSEVRLSDFTKAENLSVLLGLKTGPILLVRSCRSDLSDFTKAENLSVFTRAENWSDLAYPFCPFLPRLRTYQFLPGLRTCPIFPRAENLSGFPMG